MAGGFPRDLIQDGWGVVFGFWVPVLGFWKFSLETCYQESMALAGWLYA
jgi:hypothetical protein